MTTPDNTPDNWKSTPPRTCPHCGAPNNAWSSTEGVDVPEPETGSISLCVECGGLCVYVDTATMRKATAEEEAELKHDPMVMRSRKILSYTDSPLLASSLLMMDVP